MLRISLLMLVALLAATSARAASADISIDAKLSHGQIALEPGHTVHLRIGIAADEPLTVEDRPPMNIALVLDRSGSMSGRRIAEAKRAAKLAVSRLNADDIVSVVAYDSTVDVLVPATKVRNKARIKDKIARLEPRGSTAIYAGVTEGGEQIAKFLDRENINRVILLSDGLANVGPKRPDQFADLGRKLSRRGITVSTIGLGAGYNEDLMAALARTGEGNHAYVQEPADLANFFNKEFNDAANVVAQDVEIIITLQRGLKPSASLGRAAEIRGNSVVYRVSQLIGGSEQVLLSELEVTDDAVAGRAPAADIIVRYRAAGTGVPMEQFATLDGTFTRDAGLAGRSVDGAVMQDVSLLKARAQREAAIKLRDAGRIQEAKRVFKQTASGLKAAQEQYGFASAPRIEAELKANEAAAARADDSAAWKRQRKQLRAVQSNSASAKTRY